MQTFFVSTPIYYVNAKPHLGHAYTTIVADSLNRLHKLLGKETFFLTGTDEHGDKIVEAAEKSGENPQQYADRVSRMFKDLWPGLRVENDCFIRTTQDEHKQKVQKFLQQVYDNGDIYFGEYGGYYCFGCECFYTEKELVEGMCPDHQKPLQFIKETNYFFRMSKYQDWLRDYIRDNPEFIQPEGYKNEVLGLLREPLDDLCISRPKSRLTWGIELPFDPDYVTYVWFDALINYISALNWPQGENFKKFWPAAQHIVAKDILKPHAVFWPTMLKSAGINPYQSLHVHGYWTINEAKMSKSVGNVVEPLAMQDKYGLNAFRYFLLKEMHFGLDASFSEEALVGRLNADLANDLGNLFNRALAMTHKYFKGRVPGPEDLQAEDYEYIQSWQEALTRFIEQFEQLKFSQALESLWTLVRGLNKYIDSNAPWVLFKNEQTARLSSVMYTVLEGMRKTALCLWPVMPDGAEAMYAQLGLEFDLQAVDLRAEAGHWQGLTPESTVSKKSNLFPRQEFKAAETKEEKSAQQKEIKAEQAEEIEFSDFQKVELKTGRILVAEKVKGADKLLRLEVDLAEEKTRQIVAGLAEYYAPKDLLQKQVVVVANLKARKMRGVWSRGMVLAVHAKDGLHLVSTEGAVEPGSKVS